MNQARPSSELEKAFDAFPDRDSQGAMKAVWLPRVHSLNIFVFDQCTTLDELLQSKDVNDILDQFSRSIDTRPSFKRYSSYNLLTWINVESELVISSDYDLEDIPWKASVLSGFKDLLSSCNCRLSLLKVQSDLVSTKDLPSKHWMELLDCWSCHNSEFTVITNKLNMQTENLIMPALNTFHIGLDFILAPLENLNLEVLDIENENVSCHKCRFYIGKHISNGQDANCMKMYKSSVSLIDREGFEEEGPSFIKMFMLQMLEYIESHHTFRFIISSEEGHTELYLWLVNWQENICLGSRFRPIFHFKYLENDVETGDYERIHLPASQYVELLNGFAESRKLLDGIPMLDKMYSLIL